MKLLSSLLLLISSVGFQSCDSNSNLSSTSDQKSILVYGSDECSHCVEFKDKLDSAGLSYTFYDVEKDKSKGDEMLLKVQRTGYQGYVRFPVIEIDGEIRVAPDFNQVEEIL